MGFRGYHAGMDVSDKRGGRTLLASVLLSAPGPLVLGLGLLVGSSTTQIADFVRRTVELAATVVSWCVFRSTAGLPVDDEKRVRLEHRVDICVGIAMLVSGVAMGSLAVIGLIRPSERGNVLPALIIAILGVVSNGILALNYAAANAKTPNDVLKAQKALYRTKTVVDGCVCGALVAVILVSGNIARFADFAGGLAVTAVLCVNGIKLLSNAPKTSASIGGG